MKIVSHSSCRTSAILKYFCPLPLLSQSRLVVWSAGLQIIVYDGKLFFLFLNNKSSFEHTKHMFKLMGKKNNNNFMLKKFWVCT